MQLVPNEPEYIRFHRDNVELGCLHLHDDGHMSFEGNADESARVFMDAVISQYSALTAALHAKGELDAALRGEDGE